MTQSDPNNPRFLRDSYVRHRKGGVYKIRLTPVNVKLEATAEPAYVYEAEDGSIWCRSQVEMEDGRFTEYLEPVAAIYQ
jgi:hypothetical protein